MQTTVSRDGPKGRGVYLLTHPRSASNLFQTMMAKQPGFQNSSYMLLEASLGFVDKFDKKDCLDDWSEDEWKSIQASFQEGFDRMQEELADAEGKGNQVFIKEHVVMMGPDQMFRAAYGENTRFPPIHVQTKDDAHPIRTNPSCLPDDILLSLQPIFQIRHPMLMFPSMLRTKIKMNYATSLDRRIAAKLSLRFSRELYDWYLQQGQGDRAKVMDADDIMSNHAAVRQLCIETGLDPDSVQYEWEAREVADPVVGAMTARISASTGIVPGLEARGLDLETEKGKWKAEFGEEDGERLAQFVYDAMPDYEYLHSRRVQAVQSENP